jgi:hypothetical protein
VDLANYRRKAGPYLIHSKTEYGIPAIHQMGCYHANKALGSPTWDGISTKEVQAIFATEQARTDRRQHAFCMHYSASHV